MKKFLLPIVLAAFVAVPAQSQIPADWPEANPADVESVDAIMAAVYDVISGAAGEARDWDRFKSLFRPEAKLIPTGRQQDGSFYMLNWSPDSYVTTAGGGLETNGFFEREIYRVQEGYGDIVHLFSTYESRRNVDDAEPFARGINSFQLVNDGNRWWVVNIFWQAESAANPIPAKYLPKD